MQRASLAELGFGTPDRSGPLSLSRRGTFSLLGQLSKMECLRMIPRTASLTIRHFKGMWKCSATVFRWAQKYIHEKSDWQLYCQKSSSFCKTYVISQKPESLLVFLGLSVPRSRSWLRLESLLLHQVQPVKGEGIDGMKANQARLAPSLSGSRWRRSDPPNYFSYAHVGIVNYYSKLMTKTICTLNNKVSAWFSKVLWCSDHRPCLQTRRSY